MSYARAFLAGSLLLVVGVSNTDAGGKPKTLTTAALIVRGGDRAACIALNAGPKNADLTVELFDLNVPIFGPGSCTGTPTGRACDQQVIFGPGADHLVNCVVTATTKNVRVSFMNLTTGNNAEAK
jgi:hypothetical protein